MMTDRLTSAHWLDHGLRILASGGIHAVKVDPMARQLGVSRGSFYWHFRDIADFRAQLLRHWQDRTTDRIIARHPADGATASVHLRRLIRRAFTTDQTLDHAVRTWGMEDAAVAECVAAVDARRLAHVTRLIAATGLDKAAASARAAILYRAVLGNTLVAGARPFSPDTVADLFTAPAPGKRDAAPPEARQKPLS